MIRFLFKGIIRDRHRSRFPILIITGGVMLTVLMHSWITGVFGDIIDYNAKYATGHVKIMSRAYSENVDQMPNDLSLLDANQLMRDLEKRYPEMTWVNRITFGGLLDVPDANGETQSQGTAVAMGIDLFSPKSQEPKRLNISNAMIRGQMPKQSGEILLSETFCKNLNLSPGHSVTIITSTMFGSMSMANLVISGTIQFGIKAMDRGALIMNLSDARQILDMEDAASEILGYFNTNTYDDIKAQALAKEFNAHFSNPENEFSPLMLPLTSQNDLKGMIDFANQMAGFIIFIFVSVMSIVLWNSGLLSGLRRYGEIGLRLAIGEDKGHVYRSMLAESVIIGIMGTIGGIAIGLALSYLLQTVGFDMGNMMENATLMMPTVLRAHITPVTYYIGIFPGIISTVLGTALAGVGIYRRKTAQLFKELEV